MKRRNPVPIEHVISFDKKVKNLLFMGIKWYKLRNKLTWPEIGAIMRKNGQTYNHEQFRMIYNNWAADKIIYYSRLYAVLKIPTPTPELLVKWDKEIREMEAAEKERLRLNREKREAAKAKKQAN